MMRFIFLTFSLISFFGCKAQVPENRPEIIDPAFDDRLVSLLSFTVPLIGVQELHDSPDQFIILDSREKAEYETSHIPGAIFLGYNNYDRALLAQLDHDKPVVVYCSVGYRSEKIGEKLQDIGFTKVFNLYGSIFEWANQGYTLESASDSLTTQVHTYNKKWSQWLSNPAYKKVW